MAQGRVFLGAEFFHLRVEVASDAIFIRCIGFGAEWALDSAVRIPSAVSYIVRQGQRSRKNGIHALQEFSGPPRKQRIAIEIGHAFPDPRCCTVWLTAWCLITYKRPQTAGRSEERESIG
jgi:hypothetical protein